MVARTKRSQMGNTWIMGALLGSLFFMAGSTQASVLTTGLVAYFAGNDNAFDSSIYANNGTFPGSYASGVYGDAFNVNGQSACVSAPDIPSYSFSSEFTVGFWARQPDGFSGGTFLGQDNGSGTQSKWFVFYDSSGFGLHTNGPVYQWIRATQSADMQGNTWYHIAVVKSNTDYSFYLNGAKLGETVTASSVFPNPTASFTIGFAEAGYGFTGLIDDVVLYNRALSNDEVATLAIIPEPATICILGIGALSLIRRKK